MPFCYDIIAKISVQLQFQLLVYFTQSQFTQYILSRYRQRPKTRIQYNVFGSYNYYTVMSDNRRPRFSTVHTNISSKSINFQSIKSGIYLFYLPFLGSCQ